MGDWFTPSNQSTLNGGDTDLGSGGVLLLPDLPAGSAHTHLLVQMGKEDTIYLIDRDNMGKFCSGCSSDTQIVQEIPGATTGIWGSPAYWNGSVYWGGGNDGSNSDHVKAFSLSNGWTQSHFCSAERGAVGRWPVLTRCSFPFRSNQ